MGWNKNQGFLDYWGGWPRKGRERPEQNLDFWTKNPEIQIFFSEFAFLLQIKSNSGKFSGFLDQKSRGFFVDPLLAPHPKNQENPAFCSRSPQTGKSCAEKNPPPVRPTIEKKNILENAYAGRVGGMEAGR